MKTWACSVEILREIQQALSPTAQLRLTRGPAVASEKPPGQVADYPGGCGVVPARGRHDGILSADAGRTRRKPGRNPLAAAGPIGVCRVTRPTRGRLYAAIPDRQGIETARPGVPSHRTDPPGAMRTAFQRRSRRGTLPRPSPRWGAEARRSARPPGFALPFPHVPSAPTTTRDEKAGWGEWTFPSRPSAHDRIHRRPHGPRLRPSRRGRMKTAAAAGAGGYPGGKPGTPQRAATKHRPLGLPD